MKIAYGKMANVIEIQQDKVFSLVIENPKALYEFLIEINNAIEGIDTQIVVSENDKPLAISKKVVLLTDFVNFTINQKSLISKILSELEKTSKNETFYARSQEILSLIENCIFDIASGLPCEISCEKLNVSSLLHSAGIVVLDEYDTLEERLIAYMDLARELEEKELFIFVNLRCLIEYERLQLMVDTALSREHRILFIDNIEYPKLKKEERIIIDNDWCEI
jgi:CRISPR type II-A-associated protein Csn2